MFMKERLKAGFERLDGKFPGLKWFEDHFSACMPKGASGALPKASIHESTDEFAREVIVLWAQRALFCSRAASQSKIAPKNAGRTYIHGDSAVVQVLARDVVDATCAAEGGFDWAWCRWRWLKPVSSVEPFLSVPLELRSLTYYPDHLQTQFVFSDKNQEDGTLVPSCPESDAYSKPTRL